MKSNQMKNSDNEQLEYGDSEMVRYLANRHALIWDHMLKRVNLNLNGKSILDFGCADGSFFNAVATQYDFKSAIGIDKAHESISSAKKCNSSENIKFFDIDELNPNIIQGLNSSVDVAFSHEVIYQLPDLVSHGSFIRSCLSEEGVYVAVTGCHSDSPLWPLWKKIREERGDAKTFPHFDYAPEEIRDSFYKSGFKSVEILEFDWVPPDNFELIPRDPYRAAFWPSVAESLNFYKKDKLIFVCRL